MKNNIIILSALFLFSLSLSADDKKDILSQQEELKKVTDELNNARNNLKSLKDNEMKIQNQLTDSDQKIRSNTTVINRLNRQLRDIMADIHGRCERYGRESDEYVNYLKGANIAGFVKVADAMLAYGVM